MKDEREKFGEWAKAKHLDLRKAEDGHYFYDITELSHQAWQARAQQSVVTEETSMLIKLDSEFVNGMKAGWNFGIDEDVEGYQSAINLRRAEIKEAKSELIQQPNTVNVPIEPTEAMIWAGVCESENQGFLSDSAARNIFKAMINAKD